MLPKRAFQYCKLVVRGGFNIPLTDGGNAETICVQELTSTQQGFDLQIEGLDFVAAKIQMTRQRFIVSSFFENILFTMFRSSVVPGAMERQRAERNFVRPSIAAAQIVKPLPERVPLAAY